MELLDPRPGDVAIDCTVGLGGHAAELARRIGPAGALILNDLDPGNLSFAAEAVRALPDPPRVLEMRGNFADAPRRITSGVAADSADPGVRSAGGGVPIRAVDVVLADLGFSSNQVEDGGRGFSFMRPGPLDMRLDPAGGVTAADLVNTLSEAELGEILRDFGEEKAWRRIAQKLIVERQRAPISTTERLAEIIRSVALGRSGRAEPGRIDPATRTFQALRIAVNDEMGSLRSLLESLSRSAAMPGGWLKAGARIGIIAFHSLEDRMVKEAFGGLVKRGLAESVGRRPVEAGEDEVRRNPRSRSAKLRVVRLTCG